MKYRLKVPYKRFRVYDIEQDLLLGHKWGRFNKEDVIITRFTRKTVLPTRTVVTKIKSLFKVMDVVGNVIFVKRTTYQELVVIGASKNAKQ